MAKSTEGYKTRFAATPGPGRPWTATNVQEAVELQPMPEPKLSGGKYGRCGYPSTYCFQTEHRSLNQDREPTHIGRALKPGPYAGSEGT